MSDAQLSLRVARISWEAEGVLSLDLVDPAGGELPAFDAGAHVDLQLPNGLARSYSLFNDPRERDRYRVAVGLDAASRGGSRYVHQDLRVGALLPVSAPRNNFPLHAADGPVVLIAGGIGVTPIHCMAQVLTSRGQPWQLLYAARSRKTAAFVPQLLALAREARAHVQFHFDDESGSVADIASYLGSAPSDSHAYCCGPVPMLGAFETAAASALPAGHVHVEYFKAKAPVSLAGSFQMELRKTGKFCEVPEGKSMLDVLLDAGVDIPYSCMDGICGSCETRVLAGTPDHRDSVLSDKQRASNEVVMVCCSRSKSDLLVLDL
jgi:vanillate O-demethylase ferredoxin subunit